MRSGGQSGKVEDVEERDILVLNYTMACPLKCDFCCYGCHPGRKEKMDFLTARDLITQASEIESFSGIGFTGGEVFLYPEELLKLSSHIKDVGLSFTVATAAHWGRSRTEAEHLAETLVSNGLRRANISYDAAHSAFVQKDAIINAARSFSTRSVPTYIVGTFMTRSESLEDILPELADDPNIIFHNKLVAKVGKATKAAVDYSELDTENRMETCYRTIHHDVVVFWDGKVYPCCSTFNRATPGIVLGNINEQSLAEIMTLLDGSLLFTHLKRHGFRRLYEILERYDPQILNVLPDRSKFPGACSLCSSIFRNNDLTQRIKSAIRDYEIDVIVQFERSMLHNPRDPRPHDPSTSSSAAH